MKDTSAPVTPHNATSAPTRRKCGRKSKATPERLAKLRKLLESGMSLTGACRAVGLCPSTIHKWRQSRPEVEALIESSIGESERNLVELAVAGAKKDGRVALMLLERRFPESWSKRTEHAHWHAHADAASLANLVAMRQRRDAELAAEAERTTEAELVEG